MKIKEIITFHGRIVKRGSDKFGDPRLFLSIPKDEAEKLKEHIGKRVLVILLIP